MRMIDKSKSLVIQIESLSKIQLDTACNPQNVELVQLTLNVYQV